MNTANLSKWVDELQGQIDQLKRVVAAGGGVEVTITPELESGTKIADFTIGEESGSLYTPTIPDIPPGLDISTTETKVGTYDGSDLFCKLIKDKPLTTGENNQLGLSGVLVRFYTGKIKSSLVAYEYPLTFYSDGTTASIATTTSNGEDIRIRPTMNATTFGTLTADVVVFYTKVVTTKRGGKK